MSVMAERKNRQLSSGLKPYSTAVTVERHQLANFIEKAVQETAEWNKKMNQDRYVYRIISTKILKGLLIALPDCLECQTGDFGPGTLMSLINEHACLFFSRKKISLLTYRQQTLRTTNPGTPKLGNCFELPSDWLLSY